MRASKRTVEKSEEAIPLPSLVKREPSESLMDRKKLLADKLKRYLAEEDFRASRERLYPRQLESLHKILECLERGSGRGYLALPTGFGKTVIFAHLAEALEAKILIVEPTTPLLEQTRDRFKEHCDLVGTSAVYEKEKDTSENVVVTTYAMFTTLCSDSPAGILEPDDFDLLVLDEAHHVLGKTSQRTLSEKFADHPIMGFTATPGYSLEKHLKERVGEQIDEATIQEAVNLGILCPIRVREERLTVLGEKERHVMEANTGAADDVSKAVLELTYDKKERNEKVAEIYLYKNFGEFCVIHCASRSHADHVADAINRLFGETIAASFHGGLSAGELKRRKDAFDAGTLRVLTGDQMLGEGYDDKRISVAINAVKTSSHVWAAQRGGRPSRADRSNPAKIGTVIDVIDEGFPEGVLYRDVAGGTDILPMKSSESSGGGGGGGGGGGEEEETGEGYKSKDKTVIEVVPEKKILTPLSVLDNPKLTADRRITPKFLKVMEMRFSSTYDGMPTREPYGAEERLTDDFIDFLLEQAMIELPRYNWVTEGQLLANNKKGKSSVVFEQILRRLEKTRKDTDTFMVDGKPRKYYSPEFMLKLQMDLSVAERDIQEEEKDKLPGKATWDRWGNKS